MEKLLIAISFGLFLIIIYLVFRTTTLISLISKGEIKENIDSSNQLNAVMMIVFLVGGMGLIFWYSNRASEHFLPESASVHGDWIDQLFWITMYITGFVFVITQGLLFYFSYRYRYRPGRKAFFYPYNNKLEITWTIVPTITFIVMFIAGLSSWNKITSKAPDNAVVIEIVGQQFNWNVRYPGEDGTLGEHDYKLIDAVNNLGLDFTDRASFDDFTALQLHIPKGKPVLLKIRAKDVIHSVYIPHFRLKMDAVPGMMTRFHFVAKYSTQEMRQKLGNPDFNFEMACAEVCGRGHFAMRFIVVVEEEEDFNEWYKNQESWLSKNPEYLSVVPDELKELAKKKAKGDEESTPGSTASLLENIYF
ncbi:cytochrome c oxidase subunit 2 [Catalinimonas alkaloidigena]|uniref:cytochrome c oxidase subunit II n=1 Tax=Catalinimonas alkaloidigena TaxID=1075417 RepID=UPI0024070C47|nr:cytochrome c oxidase subunit II [Catalinimonas alkaloidigena]MDF9801358.1 cytochrome c oxidase subunit 2 [Catalinimonas alkaloidigena]